MNKYKIQKTDSKLLNKKERRVKSKNCIRSREHNKLEILDDDKFPGDSRNKNKMFHGVSYGREWCNGDNVILKALFKYNI